VLGTGIRRIGHERGASLVEFAVLLPLLVLLLIGIVEFGWLYSQNIDVRHGAREGARLAATTTVLTGPQIVTETCNRMDITGLQSVDVGLHRDGPGIGDRVEVGVRAVPTSLTGFFGALFPATLESTIETRLEQAPSWSNTGFTTC
jgi:hypothetical protein